MVLSVDFVRDMQRSVAIKCLIITVMLCLGDTSSLRLGETEERTLRCGVSFPYYICLL